MDASSSETMPQEVCCHNWFLLLDHIENAPNLQSGLKGRAAVERVIADLVNNPKYLIQDPKRPHISYPVQEKHLRDSRYWHSVEFSKRMLANAAVVIGGHRPLFRAGIPVGYNLLALWFPKRFQLFRLFKVTSIAAKLDKVNARFTRIKKPIVHEIRSGYARIAMNFLPEYRSEVISHMCDWSLGIYMGACKFTGAEDVHAQECECLTRDGKDCILELKWVDPSISRKFLIFLHNFLDPDYIQKRDLDNLYLSDAIMRQDAIIKKRTAELEASQKQLLTQERIATERHIAGGMAHEIRNALGAADIRLKHYDYNHHFEKNVHRLKQIIDKADIISGSNENEQRELVTAVRQMFDDQQKLKRNLSSIANAVQRGLRITGQVLDYAKMNPYPSQAAVNVASVIDDLINSYGDQLTNLGIEAESHLEPNMVVNGTEAQLHAVFQNLLLNARDAILEKGSDYGLIRISGTKKADHVVIQIKDDGVGISAAHQSKIFYPFFTTKPNRGIGLGLSTCQKIVRRFRGEISFTSSINQGTVFYVRLPVGASNSH